MLAEQINIHLHRHMSAHFLLWLCRTNDCISFFKVWLKCDAFSDIMFIADKVLKQHPFKSKLADNFSLSHISLVFTDFVEFHFLFVFPSHWQIVMFQTSSCIPVSSRQTHPTIYLQRIVLLKSFVHVEGWYKPGEGHRVGSVCLGNFWEGCVQDRVSYVKQRFWTLKM